MNVALVARRNAQVGSTDPPPGVLANQDPHTVTVALSEYFFDKTVTNLTSGVSAAKAVAPGDKLCLRARLPEIADVRNPLIAHAVIGSQEQHGCSKEHTP